MGAHFRQSVCVLVFFLPQGALKLSHGPFPYLSLLFPCGFEMLPDLFYLFCPVIHPFSSDTLGSKKSATPLLKLQKMIGRKKGKGSAMMYRFNICTSQKRSILTWIICRVFLDPLYITACLGSFPPYCSLGLIFLTICLSLSLTPFYSSALIPQSSSL